jgi:hypothetical protein
MALQKFLALVAGKLTQLSPLQASSGSSSAGAVVALNAAGQVDVTMMPSGVGPDTQSITASEAIAAGALVNVWSNAGALNVRNANAATGLEAHGFVLAAVANGAAGTVYFSGINTAQTGLTLGADYYLSDAGAGAIVSTAPSTAGHYSQQIGTAISATSLQFNPGPFIGL